MLPKNEEKNKYNKEIIKKNEEKKMNNKKIVIQVFAMTIISMFFLFSNNTYAQLFKAFVSSGISLSQMDGDEVYGFKQLGYTGGIGVMAPFNPNRPDDGFQASMELMYTRRGAKESTYADPFIYNAKLDYIDIPILFNYVDKRGGLTFSLGMQYGRLVKSSEKWTLPDTAIIGMDRPTNTNDSKFLKNDWSIVAGLRFTIWRNIKFDARYQYSLSPIRKNFEYNNSRDITDPLYYSWKRDLKNNYLSFKVIYVINEHHDTYKTKPKRKTAY